MALSPVGNQEPVTALWFAQQTLYAGIGSFIKAYDWTQGRLLAEKQIFGINKIHGITAYGSGKLAVWGGNSYAVIQEIDGPEFEVIVPEKRCKDWIVDVSVGSSAGSDGSTADVVTYIQTAHNEVLEALAPSGDVVKVHRCDERSILYSGKLHITAEHRWAASGTVFGGVVVWDLDSDTILHVFTEHEGSIFDVAWSPSGAYLASCSDDRAIYIWSLADERPVAQGWGHISRIWKLCFASDQLLVSAAEDCSARVWEISGPQLQCKRIFTGHKGRNVWSCALDRSGTVAATGGGDGRVMLWDLSSIDGHEASSELEWNMQAEFGDSVRDCAVNSHGTVVVATVDGNVWMWHGSGAWTHLQTSLGRMPLIKAHENIFVAVTLQGQVTVLGDRGEILASANLGHAVLGFHTLSQHTIIVQATPPITGFRVYDLFTHQCVAELEEPMRQSIMTCAALSQSRDLLCIGTRRGGLALYDLGTPRLVAFEPNALGSNDAVTAVAFASEPYVTATSRSTEFGKFSVPELLPLLKNRARRRGSVEGFADTENGLVFWGFQNDLFNTWNASLEFEIASTRCGGSHRSWGFSVLKGGEDVRLCYVRSPRFVVHTSRIQSAKFKFSMLQSGTHGREIRGIETCPRDDRLVAMGSEDTLVSLGWIRGHHIQNAVTIRNGHVSGIQSLHWDPTGRFLFTGAGQGELVMWEVTTLGDAVFTHEVSRMPSAPGTDIYDLRVMDFSVSGDLIAVAYSDSSFRIWKFGTEWRLVLRQKYRECCLLNIDLIEVDSRLRILLSSTDGHLAIYTLEKESASLAELTLRYKLHQSGIRTSALIRRGTNRYDYLSGGDDNALRRVELSFRKAQIDLKEEFTIKNAHSSSITALCATAEATRILTTSADQKVKLWSISGDLLDTRFSDISDTGAIMEHKGLVIAGGLGVEFFKLD